MRPGVSPEERGSARRLPAPPRPPRRRRARAEQLPGAGCARAGSREPAPARPPARLPESAAAASSPRAAPAGGADSGGSHRSSHQRPGGRRIPPRNQGGGAGRGGPAGPLAAETREARETRGRRGPHAGKAETPPSRRRGAAGAKLPQPWVGRGRRRPAGLPGVAPRPSQPPPQGFRTSLPLRPSGAPRSRQSPREAPVVGEGPPRVWVLPQTSSTRA